MAMTVTAKTHKFRIVRIVALLLRPHCRVPGFCRLNNGVNLLQLVRGQDSSVDRHYKTEHRAINQKSDRSITTVSTGILFER